MTATIKVLLVCTGNICRSPMAEAVLLDLVRKAGLADRFEIDSAGTGDWYAGEPAHDGTLKVLKRNGIPYDGRARQIVREDLDHFDYVLAMDSENMSFIRRASSGSSAHLNMFLRWAFDEGSVTRLEMPDPYYSGQFDRVYAMVLMGARAFLDYVRVEHKL